MAEEPETWDCPCGEEENTSAKCRNPRCRNRPPTEWSVARQLERSGGRRQRRGRERQGLPDLQEIADQIDLSDSAEDEGATAPDTPAPTPAPPPAPDPPQGGRQPPPAHPPRRDPPRPVRAAPVRAAPAQPARDDDLGELRVLLRTVLTNQDAQARELAELRRAATSPDSEDEQDVEEADMANPGGGRPPRWDCASCSFSNPSAARFCGGCGQPKAGTPAPTAAPAAPPAAPAPAAAPAPTPPPAGGGAAVTWPCTVCGMNNPPGRACWNCGAPNPVLAMMGGFTPPTPASPPPTPPAQPGGGAASVPPTSAWPEQIRLLRGRIIGHRIDNGPQYIIQTPEGDHLGTYDAQTARPSIAELQRMLDQLNPPAQQAQQAHQAATQAHAAADHAQQASGGKPWYLKSWKDFKGGGGGGGAHH